MSLESFRKRFFKAYGTKVIDHLHAADRFLNSAEAYPVYQIVDSILCLFYLLIIINTHHKDAKKNFVTKVKQKMTKSLTKKFFNKKRTEPDT